MDKWRLLGSESLVSNRWLTLRHDECETVRGERLDYYVLAKSDFAMVVPVTRGGKLILVRQYKHAAGQVVIECPAGFVDEGEAPEHAAIRELREETGYRPGRLHALGAPFSSPSVLTNRAHLFLCSDAEWEGQPRLDRGEDIELVVVDFANACARLSAGNLVSDLASTAAILLASRYLSRRPSADAT